MHVINDDGENVCKNCGIVHGYHVATDYIDFHESMHRIKRKSVYDRKYHLENKINEMSQKHNLHAPYNDVDKIHQIFKKIDKTLPQINGDRKRITSVNFVLTNLFKMLGVPCSNIVFPNSKKTLIIYQKY